MPKHLSITHKMIIAMLLLSFLATLSTLGPALYQMDRYISKESQSAAIQGVNGLQYLLEEQKKTALNFSEEAALHPPLILFRQPCRRANQCSVSRRSPCRQIQPASDTL